MGKEYTVVSILKLSHTSGAEFSRGLEVSGIRQITIQLELDVDPICEFQSFVSEESDRWEEHVEYDGLGQTLA